LRMKILKINFVCCLILGNFFIFSCSNNFTIPEETFILRMTVKRSMGSFDNGISLNQKMYVSNGNQSWAGKTLYVKLVAADYVDNVSVNPVTNINGFNRLTDAPCKTRDPIYADPTVPANKCGTASIKNVFDLPPVYEASGGIGSGDGAMTVGYVDLQGVKEGVYDLAVFVDLETSLECQNLQSCTCTRATGCSADDFALFDKYNKNDPSKPGYNAAMCHCKSLKSTNGRPSMSNGDVFYAVDNLVIDNAHKSKLKEIILQHDSDGSLTNTGFGLGDQDAWDEWRCIYHNSKLPGFNLHNYTFPKDLGNSAYCLPGTTLCPGSNDGSVTTCGTMMDFGLDYNTL